MSYNYLDKTGLASVWAKIKEALATKANSADLADVATSGSYEDLNDKPTIPSNEIFIGSTTPSGYILYIDPEGSLSNGEGVSF